MKPQFHATLFIACLALLLSQHSYATPNIDTWSTKNGAKVFYVHAPELPMVDIQVVFDAGSARDGKKLGVSALANALLDQGAGKLDADTIAAKIEGLGARLGGSSHRDMAVVSLRSLTEVVTLDEALAITAQIIQNPTYPQEAFEREKRRTLIGIQSKKESPGALANLAFYEALYPNHPYANPSSGTKETVTALTRDDLIAYHQQYYVANNAIVAIVGSLDKDAANAAVEKLLGGLPAGQAAPPLPAVTLPSKARKIEKYFPSTQTHILVGIPAVKRGAKDYFQLYVGNHRLGGSGLVSKISEEIREKRGLAYSAYSYFMPMRGSGPFIMGLQTKNDQVDEALKVLNQTLRDYIASGPTDDQLEASKKNITGGFPLRIASNKKIVGYLAMIGFYGMPLDYLDAFIGHVDSVSQKEIVSALKNRLLLDKLVTVVVGGGAQKP